MKAQIVTVESSTLMRAVIQRSGPASVSVAGQIVGRIDGGIVALVGVEQGDTEIDVQYLANKTAELRIFADDQGKMNRSIEEVGGKVLAVSQFTLLGDARKGRRPSFTAAADPTVGQKLFEQYVERLRARRLEVVTGVFRSEMQVALVNEGPVTVLLDSRKRF